MAYFLNQSIRTYRSLGHRCVIGIRAGILNSVLAAGYIINPSVVSLRTSAHSHSIADLRLLNSGEAATIARRRLRSDTLQFIRIGGLANVLEGVAVQGSVL